MTGKGPRSASGNCIDGSGSVRGGNPDVTPPWEGQLLSAAQRMRTERGLRGETREAAISPRQEMVKRVLVKSL